MRQQFQRTTSDLLADNDELVLLLGDIGVHSFRSEFATYPSRVLNFGIMEQTMVSFASGLAASGLVPVLHSIAPFLVERALEQIKIDFGYQGLRGNFVSVGASFDYAALGGTHHAPGDVAALLAVPGLKIFLPGHEKELDDMMRTRVMQESLNYFRLSEISNADHNINRPGEGSVLRNGDRGTVIVFGPLLDPALEAIEAANLQVIYLTELTEQSVSHALSMVRNRKVLIVEPFYEASSAGVFARAQREAFDFRFVGVPLRFIHSYGSVDDQLEKAGLDSQSLAISMRRFFDV